jgi:hypothetical protein
VPSVRASITRERTSSSTLKASTSPAMSEPCRKARSLGANSTVKSRDPAMKASNRITSSAPAGKRRPSTVQSVRGVTNSQSRTMFAEASVGTSMRRRVPGSSSTNISVLMKSSARRKKVRGRGVSSACEPPA